MRSGMFTLTPSVCSRIGIVVRASSTCTRRRRWDRLSRWPRPACGWFPTAESSASAACRSGRLPSAIWRKSSSGCKRVGEIEGAGHVELVHGRAVVEQLQELNLGGAQVDDGRLQLRFVLHAQQLDAVEIDLRDVAGVKPVAADGDDLVVVVQIGLGHIQHGLGLAASAQMPRAK